MQGSLLGRGARLGPNASLKIDICPAGSKNLTATGAGEQQQPDDIGSLRIVRFGEGLREPLQFIGRQIALPLMLVIALDTLSGVVRAPAPADRKGEHLGEDRGHAVGAVRGASLRDLAVQSVNVGVRDIDDFEMLERRKDIEVDRALVVRSRVRSFFGR